MQTRRYVLGLSAGSITSLAFLSSQWARAQAAAVPPSRANSSVCSSLDGEGPPFVADFGPGRLFFLAATHSLTQIALLTPASAGS